MWEQNPFEWTQLGRLAGQRQLWQLAFSAVRLLVSMALAFMLALNGNTSPPFAQVNFLQLSSELS